MRERRENKGKRSAELDAYRGERVPTGTGTRDIPEHFCLIPKRVVLVSE